MEHRQPGDDGWFGEGTICSAQAAIGLEPSARIWTGGAHVAPRVLYRQVASDGKASVRIDIGCQIEKSGIGWPKPFEVADAVASFLEMPVRIAVPRPNHAPQTKPLGWADFRLAEAYLWASTAIQKDPSATNQLDDQLLAWLAPKIPCVIAELDPLDLVGLDERFKPVVQWDKAGVDLLHWPMLHLGRPALVWVLKMTVNADPQFVAQIRKYLVRLHAEVACLSTLLNGLLDKRHPIEDPKLDAAWGFDITPEPRSDYAQTVQFCLKKMTYRVRRLDQDVRSISTTSGAQTLRAALVGGDMPADQRASGLQALKDSFDRADFRPTVKRDVFAAVETAPAMLRLDPFEGPWTPFVEAFASPLYVGSPADVEPENINADEVGALYWNTTLPSDNAAEKTGWLFTNVSYRLRTAIEPKVVVGGGLTPGAKVEPPGAEELSTTKEGEQYFNVHFRFVVSGAGVRVVNGDGPFVASLTSEVRPCKLGKGAAPFEVEMRSTESGAVSIEITLFVRGAVALRRTVNFVATRAGETSPPSRLNPLRSVTASLGKDVLSLTAAHVQLTVRFDHDWDVISRLKDNGHTEEVKVHLPANNLYPEVVRERAKLVKLSQEYKAKLNPQDPLDPLAGLWIEAPDDCLLSFARIGAKLHQAIFGRKSDRTVPTPLSDLAAELRNLGKADAVAQPRLQIDAPHLPVPWAVLYDGPDPELEHENAVKLEHFWGVRFNIDRVTIVSSESGTLAEAGKVQACINARLDVESEGIAVVAPQKKFFADIAAAHIIESRSGFEEYVKSGVPCQLLYFFCHAAAAQELDDHLFPAQVGPEDAANIFLDETPMSIPYLELLWDGAKGPIAGRPLVFINACASAQGDEGAQSLLLRHFRVRWGACGFIGTDWAINRVFADAFARLVLDHFLVKKKTISEAFREASNTAFARGNPFPLIYALYVRPDMKMP